MVYLLIRMGEVLYLLRSLLLLRIRCKKFPPCTPCDLCMFRIMIIFTLCFRMSKGANVGEGSQIQLSPHPRSLVFGMPHPTRSLPYALIHCLLEGREIFPLLGFTHFLLVGFRV